MYYVIQINKEKAGRIKAMMSQRDAAGVPAEITEEIEWPGQQRDGTLRFICGRHDDGTAYAQAALYANDGSLTAATEPRQEFFGAWNLEGLDFMVKAEPDDPALRYDRRTEPDGKFDSYIPEADAEPAGTFEFGGYHFTPIRKHNSTDNFERMRLGSRCFGDRLEADYNQRAFLAASTDPECDIYRCVENGRHYMAGFSLSEYMDPYLLTVTELAEASCMRIRYMCPFCNEVHEVRVYRAQRSMSVGELRVRCTKLSFICERTGKEFIPYADLHLKNIASALYAASKEAVGRYTELLMYDEAEDAVREDGPAYTHELKGLDTTGHTKTYTIEFDAPDRNRKGCIARYRCAIIAGGAEQALGVFFRAHPHIPYEMAKSFGTADE